MQKLAPPPRGQAHVIPVHNSTFIKYTTIKKYSCHFNFNGHIKIYYEVIIASFESIFISFQNIVIYLFAKHVICILLWVSHLR